jgi:hypothetical protein
VNKPSKMRQASVGGMMLMVERSSENVTSEIDTGRFRVVLGEG